MYQGLISALVRNMTNNILPGVDPRTRTCIRGVNHLITIAAAQAINVQGFHHRTYVSTKEGVLITLINSAERF